MMTKPDMFEGLIGQDSLKTRLEFYSEAKNATCLLYTSDAADE